jgi:beta-galactosidase/beta-glucuronidase
MYTTGGCRGDFVCNGKKVSCQSYGGARKNCSCGAPHSSISASKTVMQRPNVSAPYADFQRNFSFAKYDFNDDAWARTSLPHDCLINQTFDPDAGEGAAYLPRTVVWYRKHFMLPQSFRGQHIELYMQGAFQYAEIYVNGNHVVDHSVGYTTFTARLDNVSSLVYQSEGSNASVNTIAIRVDPTFGSGHWYEGGGINRPLSLVVSPLGPRFVQNGVFANPNSDGTSLRVSAEIEDLSKQNEGADLKDPRNTLPLDVKFTLRDESGSIVAQASTPTGTPTAAAPAIVHALLTPKMKLKTWSPQTPVTYELTAEVGTDAVNITTGVRVFDWNRSKAQLNGHTIELQGFSHHPSFAGMGAMTSPRLALFLAQTTKALGMNFWRNSHNPYEDAVYQVLTEVGVMNWDENRQLGSDHAVEYHDMIKAHRNYPAVMLYGKLAIASVVICRGAV